MNNFQGKGRLFSFESRHVGGNTVAKLTLILPGPSKKNKQTGEWERGEGTFVDCEIWNLNESKANYLSQNEKKCEVYVAGRLAQDKWKDKQGNNRSKFKIAADVIDAKPIKFNNDRNNKPVTAQKAPERTTYVEEPVDSDIPF